MALPIAVRRPVVRLSMTSRRTSWSVVGDCTISAKPANATMPICVAGALTLDERRRGGLRRQGGGWARCPWRTCCANVHGQDHRRLVGGTLTMATGRAMATTRLARASTNRANGRWRRTRDERGNASRTATGSSSARRSAAVAGPRCRPPTSSRQQRRGASRSPATAGPCSRQPSRARAARRRRRAAGSASRRPRSGEVDLDRLGPDHEPRVEAVVDLAQLLGVVGRVVGAVRSARRSARSTASSSWLWTLKPSTSSVVPSAAADADGVDPDAAITRRPAPPRADPVAGCSRRR